MPELSRFYGMIIQMYFDVKQDFDGPAFQPLREETFFRSVFLQYGTAVWPGGRIDIAPENLYRFSTPISP
ncbi:MAG: DUF2442 domain-containing protein [Oscillospiraceae bacterium]|nr:DUF2442 domain-containing protein [Oscillospiraceae bacterium]